MRKRTAFSVIAEAPPNDGREWDNQCARCGSSVYLDNGDGPRGCMSSPEWCEANPIKGREHVKRGKIEWFTFDKKP